MPVLSNPRHERFAQGVARGKSLREAYVFAGYSSKQEAKNLRSNAGVLFRRPEVATRIEELQEKQAKRVAISVDDLLKELNDMLRLAKQVKHPAAGVGAILAKGKLLGLITDKAEVETSTVRKPSKEATDRTQMSLEEWQKKFAPRGGETLQ